MNTYEVPVILADEQGNPRSINPAKLGENWMVLPANDYPLALTSGITSPTGFSVPEDAGVSGDYEVAGIVGRPTVPCTIELKQVGINSGSFMNVPIHHALLLGRRGLPCVFAETLLIESGGLIQALATPIPAANGQVSLALIGRKFNTAMPPEEAQARLAFLAARPTRPYWLGLDSTFVTLSANATVTDKYLTMPSGAFFVVEDLMKESTGRFQIQIFDGNSGRELTNGYIDSDLIFGTGGLPQHTLGSPIVSPRKSLRVNLKDVSGAANTIYLGLHGQRLNLAPPSAAAA